jgi:agmatine deiminase
MTLKSESMQPFNRLPTPRQLGYRWPAEWEPHRATWLVWPHNVDTWPGRFEAARRQFAQLVRAIIPFESVELLAVGAARDSAQQFLGALSGATIREIPTNDSWIRDHGPIFLGGPAALPPALLDWQYNAWGEKYPPFDLDNLVPQRIAELTGRQAFSIPMVLEGGSVDGNGAGLVLTTEPCLLNPNRNPGLDRATIEQMLRDYLCADHVIWLTGEIAGDDTDSHIDQIARFVDASTVVVLDDATGTLFTENSARLKAWSEQSGIELQVVRLAAPRPRREGSMDLPVSYANFYLTNGGVIVPVFGDPADDSACDTLQKCFPRRQVVPVRAEHLIYGLGAFHCLTQQEPL